MVGRMGGRRTAKKKRRKNFVLGSPFWLFYSDNELNGISITFNEQVNAFVNGKIETSINVYILLLSLR